MQSKPVEARKPLRLSATRVKQFVECPRKWHLYAVCGWEGPVEVQAYNPAFAFGTELHMIAENWLKKGTPPPATDAGRLFAKGAKYWPAPRTPGVVVEQRFTTGNFRGAIDVLIEGETPIVGDHKTIGDFKGAMDAEALSNDIQAIAYGHHVAQSRDAENVTLRWVYYRKNGAAATRKVEVTLPRSHLIEGWEKIMIECKKMVDQYEERKYPQEIEGNKEACNNYGGCEFRARCAQVDLLKGDSEMSKLAQILAKKKAAEAGGRCDTEVESPAEVATKKVITQKVKLQPKPKEETSVDVSGSVETPKDGASEPSPVQDSGPLATDFVDDLVDEAIIGRAVLIILGRLKG